MNKIATFILLLSLMVLGLTVFRYERIIRSLKSELKQKKIANADLAAKFSNKDIIELIRKSPRYLGDTVTINPSGQLLSSNGKFQGTINAVTDHEENMVVVEDAQRRNQLPLQFNIYELAAGYYRSQYPDEFPQQQPK
jgi:hypothetical protein